MERLSNGFPAPPKKVTQYVLVVWNTYCDSRSEIVGRTSDEAWAKYEAGRSACLYGSVIGDYAREGFDSEEYRSYILALEHTIRTSCVMPPAEDLQLLAKAKATDPEEWKTIDYDAGRFSSTRERLRQIRNDKMNACWQKDTP